MDIWSNISTPRARLFKGLSIIFFALAMICFSMARNSERRGYVGNPSQSIERKILDTFHIQTDDNPREHLASLALFIGMPVFAIAGIVCLAIACYPEKRD